MGRTMVLSERKRIDVLVLRNQLEDMAKVKEVTGKTMTDIISEALALWLALMRKEGVL